MVSAAYNHLESPPSPGNMHRESFKHRNVLHGLANCNAFSQRINPIKTMLEHLKTQIKA